MDGFSYFHFCDHRFRLTDDDATENLVTLDNGGVRFQLLVDKARILDIIEVKAVTFDSRNPQAGADEVDYSQYVGQPLPTALYAPYLHNRIHWLVKPPTKYTVKVRMLPIAVAYKEYVIDECPRCQGKAWFVDIFNQDGVYVLPVGIERVTQRVIKDIFTRIGSNILDDSYGSPLERQIFRRANVTDEQMFDDIRLVVSEVEDGYLRRQAADLDLLQPEEILRRLYVSRIFRVPKRLTQVILEITVQTQAESRTLRIPI